MLVKGKQEQRSPESQQAQTHKKFFQCGRQESCTHVITTLNEYVLVYGIEELRRREHQAVYIYEKQQLGKLALS